MSVENAAILFAKDLVEWVWDDGPSTEEGQTVLRMAEARGIILWRKPKPAELADAEWWGHEFQIGPDDKYVGEFTPEFRAAITKAKGDTHAQD